MSEKALCEVNMTYATMRSYFRAAERARQHLSGFIVFSPASFDKEYSVEAVPMRCPATTRRFGLIWADIPSMLRPWMAPIPVSAWNSIWHRSTAARTAGKLSGAI